VTWLEDLKATPAEVAAVDQVLAEVAEQGQQHGDDDDDNDGPWHDDSGQAGGSDA
jgi:hypothetical protein